MRARTRRQRTGKRGTDLLPPWFNLRICLRSCWTVDEFWWFPCKYWLSDSEFERFWKESLHCTPCKCTVLCALRIMWALSRAHNFSRPPFLNGWVQNHTLARVRFMKCYRSASRVMHVPHTGQVFSARNKAKVFHIAVSPFGSPPISVCHPPTSPGPHLGSGDVFASLCPRAGILSFFVKIRSCAP